MPLLFMPYIEAIEVFSVLPAGEVFIKELAKEGLVMSHGGRHEYSVSWGGDYQSE